MRHLQSLWRRKRSCLTSSHSCCPTRLLSSALKWYPLNVRNFSAIPTFIVSIHESYSSEFGGASPHTYMPEREGIFSIHHWMTDTHPRHLGCGICMRLTCFLKSLWIPFDLHLQWILLFLPRKEMFCIPSSRGTCDFVSQTYPPVSIQTAYLNPQTIFHQKKKEIFQQLFNQHLERTGSLLIIYASKYFSQCLRRDWLIFSMPKAHYLQVVNCFCLMTAYKKGCKNWYFFNFKV